MSGPERARRLLKGAAERLRHPLAGRGADDAANGGEGAPADPTVAAGQDDTARVQVALDAVAMIEAIEPSLPTATAPVTLWARGRVARRAEVDPGVATLVPPSQRRGWEPGGDHRSVEAAVAADVVVLGKFDVGEQPKLRAAYGAGRRTLAARPPSSSGVCGITRTVEALRAVQEHAPGLAPELLGHGRVPDGLPYVVEAWVDGETLRSATALADAAPQILKGLGRLHRGHGVEAVPLTTHWGDGFAERWEATRATGIVPDDLGRWVADLIARDLPLHRSWTHGDLVASNVVRTADGIVLVDWEHSFEAPVMNDGAKLHLFAERPQATMEAVLGALEAAPEELALCHAQLISQYPRRHAALRDHGRAEVYERQVARQLERLQQVREHLEA